jgi:glycine/D-amino acid oxidase-like deaminating enzyme
VKAFDVAVIGLGAMGSAALFNLAKRGRRVIGFEQFEPGHKKGSSHGESRAIRLSYFEHSSYVPLARRACEAWWELELVSGETVLTVTGILEAGHPGSPVVKGSFAEASLHGLPHKLLTGAEINRRFPVFTLESEDDTCYGFPDFTGTGVNVASHREGAVLAAANANVQDGGAADEAQLRRMFRRLIPDADGPLRKMRTYLYTRTPDEDFIVDCSAHDSRIVLASPCSGHGFKFASVLGEVLADFATGRASANDIAPFRVDRLRASQGAGTPHQQIGEAS